jgi:SepF-like predicted cell division protein (DUF552 family)
MASFDEVLEKLKNVFNEIRWEIADVVNEIDGKLL